YTGALGIHYYMCLIAGETELYTGEPLTSEECLDFLARLPVEKGTHYVSFFFDYDSTMILREFAQTSPDKACVLLNVKPMDEDARALWQPKPYGAPVIWRGYGIDYVPKKHISVL